VTTIQAWESVRQRWQPDSHVWDGVESIPIETARNEILDLCDGIDAMRQRAEAAEAVLKLRNWQHFGPCPLCSAPNARGSYDVENGVRITYCLSCGTAVLWQNETPPATGTTTGWDAATFYSGHGEPD
jgi:hypothetical protein